MIHELTNLPRNYKNLTVSLSQRLLTKTSIIGQEITYQYGWKYRTDSAFKALELFASQRCYYSINDIDYHAVNIGQRFVWTRQYSITFVFKPCSESECSNYEASHIPPCL